MPIPPTLTSYLPVLMISVTHSAAPDDTSFSTLPEGQVDYLSHEWREEDVWRSWRSMTRQKNAIANGMRLENASWRTWWKQRNKLKTISPETLNWLKDSDVTWLYGPLHVGSDWSPSRNKGKDSLHKVKRQNSTDAVSSAAAPASHAKKPILKHRSISQLLSLPSSRWFEHGDSDEEEDEIAEGQQEDPSKPMRPPLLHTKSDTHISLRGRPHRKDSPPRIIAEDAPAVLHAREMSIVSSAPTTTPLSEASMTAMSDHDLSGSSSASGDGSTGSGATSDSGLKKKHISFNTFVEQCIAIEKPNHKRPAIGGSRGSPVFSYDDGYEEGSEGGGDDDSYDSPSNYFMGAQSGDNSDSDDDDDDVIEMRSSRSRASSISSTNQSVQFATNAEQPSTPHPRFRPPLMRKSSTSGDRVTIAPIAPTILKSTGVGNNLRAVVAGRVTPAPKDVELVYAPPHHSNYSLPGTPNVASPAAEEVYHHRESYFSVGTNPSPQSHSPTGSPQIPMVGALPPPPQISSSPPKYEAHARQFFAHQPAVDSPMHVDDMGDAPMEDTFDFFDGSTEDIPSSWSAPELRRTRGRADSRDDFDHRTGGMVRYAEGGAASVPTGRRSGVAESTYSPGQSPDTPVVVVNEVNGATEERTERSREGSPSFADLADSDNPASPPTYVHTLSAALPVPRIGTANPYIAFSPQTTDSVLLSPSDIMCRGRTPPATSSVGGSTTSGSTSYTRSTDSRSESRGRSVTRNSSFSDRERSSSRGTSSPMGSLSPTGSALGLGAASVYVRGRDRESSSRSSGRGRTGSDEVERGRERTGRSLAASVSPPNPAGSPTQANSDMEWQAHSPSMLDGHIEKLEAPSPPSSVSGSSTASASTARQPVYNESVAAPRPRVSLNASAGLPPIALPSPIPEEDEQRSRHPTPANSPISGFNLTPHPSSSESTSVPPAGQPIAELPSPTYSPEVKAGSTSPVPIPRTKDRVPRASLDGQQDQSGFVGRAADMVSTARGFLGSIWNAGTA